MTITITDVKKEGYSDLLQNPSSLVNLSNEELFNLDPDLVKQIQLSGAQQRFKYFYSRIKSLRKLVDAQNISDINTLNDLAPILFQHTVYKSYPLAFIEKRRFNLLTQWLDKLTIHDLSSISTEKCKSIDSWLESIENQSAIEIVHSTGTTGKLSFLPRSNSEMENFKKAFFLFVEALTGVDPNQTTMPVFFPGFSDGRQLAQRVLSRFGPILAGSKDEYHTA
ncbi:MAG: hypothetical protein ACXAB7_25265, partial [Candidatus Kariarchaeaceae archaeon]